MSTTTLSGASLHTSYKEDVADPSLATMMFLQATALAAAPAATIAFGQWQFGAAAAIALSAGLWKVSLAEVPATPKKVAILKLRGKPIRVLKERGWRIVPLRGFFLGFDLIELDVNAEELEIVKEDNLVLTTPEDRVQSPPVSIAVTWRPDYSCADALTRYHDYSHGGHKEEISDFLQELVEERARQYANDPIEGPKTIEELVNSTLGLTHAVMKMLGGHQLNKIESRVPTDVLLEWYNSPAGPTRKSIGDAWGVKWEKVEEILRTEDRTKVREQVVERDRQMRKAMSGRAEIHLEWLGIVIEKVAVSEIEEPKELAQARLLKKQAVEQNEASRLRLLALRNRIAEFMGVKPEEVKLTREQALPMVASDGKLGEWKLNEERKSYDFGSSLAEVLGKMGIKFNIESSSAAAGTKGGSK